MLYKTKVVTGGKRRFLLIDIKNASLKNKELSILTRGGEARKKRAPK
jgi:hypothetical protein